MADMFTPQHLNNGVQVEFIDKTNRYYGDYYRVCIEVVLRLNNDEAALCSAGSNQGDGQGDGQQGGQAYQFQTIERMGVSGDDLVTVKQQVLDSFCRGTMVYMARDSFPEKFKKSLTHRKSTLLPGLK